VTGVCGGAGGPSSSYTYSTSVLDQLTSVSSTTKSFGYDGDGHTTRNGPDRLCWDGADRLTIANSNASGVTP
jgi:hypothetical protein